MLVFAAGFHHQTRANSIISLNWNSITGVSAGHTSPSQRDNSETPRDIWNSLSVLTLCFSICKRWIFSLKCLSRYPQRPKVCYGKVKCVNYLLCLRACNLQKNNHFRCFFCSKLAERCVAVSFCSCWKGRGAILFHFLICFDLLSFEEQWQRNIFEYLLFFSKLDHIIAFWICEPYNGNVKS